MGSPHLGHVSVLFDHGRAGCEVGGSGDDVEALGHVHLSALLGDR